jgi:hypothetical protein
MTQHKKNPAAVSLGKRSVAARMKNLSPARRKAIAKHAAQVRWSDPKERERMAERLRNTQPDAEERRASRRSFSDPKVRQRVAEAYRSKRGKP